MKKLIISLSILFIFFGISKTYACSPSFPALWPPSITSTLSTDHSVSITWSMSLPFVGDITAYRIYLNGNLVHTISPNITSLMFEPAGHGAYSVQGLQPDTVYNEAVGVVFAIPVGCGITWNVEMKSSANIRTQKANWLQNAQNGEEAVSNGYQVSKPHSPVVRVSDITETSADVSYDISNAYNNTDFTQKNYQVTRFVVVAKDVCSPDAFSAYASNYAFYSEEKGYYMESKYDCKPERYIYYTGTGRNKTEHAGEKYKYNISSPEVKKTINLSGTTGIIKLNLISNTPYVIYGYDVNSNGDESNISAPIEFLTPEPVTKEK